MLLKYIAAIWSATIIHLKPCVVGYFILPDGIGPNVLFDLPRHEHYFYTSDLLLGPATVELRATRTVSPMSPKGTTIAQELRQRQF